MKNRDDHLLWKEVRTEQIVKDEWIDFRRTDYEFPDGNIYGPFYSYSRRSYVVIVALNEEGRLICVRQFRHGIREITTEFPAGGIENMKDAEHENALEAAIRELREETGYVSDHWVHLMTLPSNATVSDNYAFMYLALGCRKVGEQSLDEMEFLDVLTCSPEEVDALIRQGEFKQAMHVLAWMLAKEWRAENGSLAESAIQRRF